MGEEKLIDSNILVYSVDRSEQDKHRDAEQLVKEVIEDGNAFLSVQNLSEFYRVATEKIDAPVSKEVAQRFIDRMTDIREVEIAGLTAENLQTATRIHNNTGSDFWDCLIAAVMRENSVRKIYTENVEDFRAIEGVEPENPFNS